MTYRVPASDFAAVKWLNSRAPLKKKLDDIRSRGHYEHKETLRDRSFETPLRIQFRCDAWPDVTDEHIALIRSTDELLGLNMPPAERPDKVNLKHWVEVARAVITAATETPSAQLATTHQTSERSASSPVGNDGLFASNGSENRERDAMSDVVVRRGALDREVSSDRTNL